MQSVILWNTLVQKFFWLNDFKLKLPKSHLSYRLNREKYEILSMGCILK